MLGKKYSYYVNGNRYHGFELNPLKLKGYLVIASDFTITQDEVQALVDNDVVLLSTDHHDCQHDFIDIVGETAEGIVINNQYPFEPEDNRYQSGAGVFYELICELYPEFKSKEREACVGITLLSDMRPIENEKAKKYLRTTYSADTEQGYLKYLIESVMDTSKDYSFGLPKMDRNFIDYNLSPCINSLLRFDRTQEAINFILGYGLKQTAPKEQQKKLIELMNEKAQICKFNNCVFLVVNALDFINYDVKVSAFIGLMCNDYKSNHGGVSTLGIVTENGKVIRASFRGRYDDIHYQSGFRTLGLHAEGHPSAFGINDFYPNADTWYQIDDLIADLEATHKSTITILNTNNLSLTLTQKGANIATTNCYVRDMYRTYLKYTGSNAKISKINYKMEELTPYEKQVKNVTPDTVIKGKEYVYLKDEEGRPQASYIEYTIDGRKVKSFGVYIEDGIILPVLERGYIQLYLRGELS